MKPLKGPTGYFARRMSQKNPTTWAPTDMGPRGGPVLKSNKGMKGGSCNRTHCQMPASEDHDGIRWFNHSTRKYYCGDCAWELNNDSFNKRDAQQIWGHDLCTLETE